MRAVVLFTRDLRVHDHRVLSAVVRTFDRVVPLFVFDGRLLGSRNASNRIPFLLDALADLRESLRERGADLVVRRGDPVEQTLGLAQSVGATNDLRLLAFSSPAVSSATPARA